MNIVDKRYVDTNEESQTKKLYHTPELTEYGDLAELTKGGAQSGSNDLSTYISFND